MGRKKKKPIKPWCWYCNREFDDEKILIQHQRAKHYKCPFCHKKLYSGPGLTVHCVQVHKEKLDKVPEALPNRNTVHIDIYGMQGVPEEDLREHERSKRGDEGTSRAEPESKSQQPNKSTQQPQIPISMGGMPPQAMHSAMFQPAMGIGMMPPGFPMPPMGMMPLGFPMPPMGMPPPPMLPQAMHSAMSSKVFHGMPGIPVEQQHEHERLKRDDEGTSRVEPKMLPMNKSAQQPQIPTSMGGMPPSAMHSGMFQPAMGIGMVPPGFPMPPPTMLPQAMPAPTMLPQATPPPATRHPPMLPPPMLPKPMLSKPMLPKPLLPPATTANKEYHSTQRAPEEDLREHERSKRDDEGTSRAEPEIRNQQPSKSTQQPSLTRIMHPNEDLSLEEIRLSLTKYRKIQKT